MHSFQRLFAVFSIVIVSGLLSGCGGAGKPTPGSSDPATEAANAVLAPEGGTGEGGPAVTEKASAEETAPAPETTEPAAEDTGAASAPESGE